MYILRGEPRLEETIRDAYRMMVLEDVLDWHLFKEFLV